MLESDSVNNSYQQFVTEVDRMTLALSSRFAAHLQCRSGCSGCCQHHLSVFRVEAQVIANAVQGLPEAEQSIIDAQARHVLKLEEIGTEVSCPLLVNDTCSVYQSRPVICRTQGLPLLFDSQDGSQEVDWCPLNFTDEGAELDLDDAHLVPLDQLNLTLALINLRHSRERGLTDNESGDRVSIARIILNPDQI